MKMFKRRAKWVVRHAALLGLLYVGIHNDSAGWTRVALFVAWGLTAVTWVLTFGVCMAALFTPEKIGDKSRAVIKRPPFPLWVTALLDISACLWLVYCGWIFTGIAWLSTLLTAFCIHGVIPHVLEIQEAKRAEKTGEKVFEE